MLSTNVSAQLQPAYKPTVSAAQNGDARLYTYAEYMPVYPGGQKQLPQDIAAAIHYPKSAKTAGLGGNIRVGFTVDREGAVRDVKLVEGMTVRAGKEAVVQELQEAGLQAVRNLTTRWKPGVQNNKRVNVSMIITLPLQP